MEVNRQLDMLNRPLADVPFLSGDEYSIAEIAVWPWYGALAKGLLYGGCELLQAQDYKHMRRWTDGIAARPAVQRGRMANRVTGNPTSQRHEASDFDTRTADKLAKAG